MLSGTDEEGRFAFLRLFEIAFLRFVCSSLLRFDPGRFLQATIS